MDRTPGDNLEPLNVERLIGLAHGLGCESVGRLSAAERRLLLTASPIDAAVVRDAEDRIDAGQDPLGDAFCRLRSARQRRSRGATYTPPSLVERMVEWAAAANAPQRIVDPGTGSARFLVAAARRIPGCRLIGVEIDPLAALLARAHLATAGFAGRSRILLRDYRTARLPGDGKTLYLGNPPYVRHHDISPRWKTWLTEAADKLKLRISCLSGMHVHFLVATALRMRDGDRGCLITSGEWLDVNYGRSVRELFLERMGGCGLSIFEPTALPFDDAATTSTIFHFTPGAAEDNVRLEVVEAAAVESAVRAVDVPRQVLRNQERWRLLALPSGRETPLRNTQLVALGEYCRVNRGQVTGANKVWIADSKTAGWIPERFRFRCVTRARELFEADGCLSDGDSLRQVIDLPVDLSELPDNERAAVDEFLEAARRQFADQSYVARHRRAWWSVGLYPPAPILASYMARRPPTFIENAAAVRHINIAHGLYPRIALQTRQTRALIAYLRHNVRLESGRIYAGGLTKFEPKEMERLLVPRPEHLLEHENPLTLKTGSTG